jgi:uncharacterized repeat protein (TIGR04138 family)
MSTTSRAVERDVRYHPNAYQFVYAALRFTQQCLDRPVTPAPENEDAHISGVELLDGIRAFALSQFGLMTQTVFRLWGIRSTDDFGNIVFELIDRGEMSKTDRDQLSDFFDVYDFAEVFDRSYRVEVKRAFSK